MIGKTAAEEAICKNDSDIGSITVYRTTRILSWVGDSVTVNMSFATSTFVEL